MSTWDKLMEIWKQQMESVLRHASIIERESKHNCPIHSDCPKCGKSVHKGVDSEPSLWSPQGDRSRRVDETWI